MASFENDIAHDLVAAINRYLLTRTPIKPATLCFVFGTRHGEKEFAEAVARLWRADHFRYAIVSGGKTPGADQPEAIVLRRHMLDGGIPASAIVVEIEATNTGENVTRSLPILDRSIGLRNIDSLIAVGKLCTSRRYLMTLQRHWPEVIKMLLPINYFPIHWSRWTEHRELRARVLNEWSKIEPYRQKGFIVELQRVSLSS